MLRDRTIVCLSSIDWDFLWQVHQHVMSTLAEQGNRVLFVESTGVRAPVPHDLPRLWRRLRGGGRGHGARWPRPDNVQVYSPVVLPFPYSRVAQAVNRPIMHLAIRRRMAALGATRPIVWNFLPTPLSRSLVRALDPLLSLFHCLDHLSTSSPAAARLNVAEAQCLAEADLVFANSHAAFQRAHRVNANTHFTPSGVDLPRFEQARESEAAVPEEMRALPRPRIGYLGGLHQWVDQVLLAAVASRHPDWSFVLVGPTQTDVSALTRLSNVHRLGARGPDQVPRCLRGFDVGIVPYRLTDYTHDVYPAKLNEYLAMGLGVVATPLAEIERFNEFHGGVVRTGANAEGFASAIAEALADRDPARTERRMAVARTNSWAARIEQMSALIDDTLARRMNP